VRLSRKTNRSRRILVLVVAALLAVDANEGRATHAGADVFVLLEVVVIVVATAGGRLAGGRVLGQLVGGDGRTTRGKALTFLALLLLLLFALNLDEAHDALANRLRHRL
jgi:hypothetical protein